MDDSTSEDFSLLQKGVVLLKKFLSPELQLQFWSEIEKGAKSFKTEIARNPKSTFTKILKINPKFKQKIPPLFEKMAATAMEKASSISPEIPSQCSINFIASFSYPVPDGKLQGHCDSQEGWVLIFSFGCIAKFWVQGKEMPTPVTFDFSSGDALIFNSSAAWNIRHGINSITPNSAPSFLPDSLQNSRAMLQYRQLGKGVIPQKIEHFVFTVKEVLTIDQVLHSQVDIVMIRGKLFPIQTGNGIRSVIIHGIECCTQQKNIENSQWSTLVEEGHHITLIKSPGHWGRIVDGNIINKGTAITGHAEGYHLGSKNIQPLKKQKGMDGQSITTQTSATVLDQKIESYRELLLLVEYKEKKKKMNLVVATLEEMKKSIMFELGIPEELPIRLEYEDEDFKEFVSPTWLKEIPNKARIRITGN